VLKLWLVLLPILWLPLLLLLLWFSVGVNFVVSLVTKGVAVINVVIAAVVAAVAVVVVDDDDDAVAANQLTILLLLWRNDNQ
jgi:hypothetical protein